MEAAEQTFPVVLSTVLYRAVQTSNIRITLLKRLGSLTGDYSNTCKLLRDFLVVLFIMLHNMVLTCESVDEILKCDHSNESC